jgi:hypothetical protein
MRVELKNRLYFTCPNGCSHEFLVQRLFDEELTPFALTSSWGPRGEKQAGPWYCGICYQGWNLRAFRDGTLDVEPAPSKDGITGKCRPHLVLLKIPPQDEEINLVVQGMSFTEEINEESEKFYYEENTCPINYLRAVQEVHLGENTDPHGLAEYLGRFHGQAPRISLIGERLADMPVVAEGMGLVKNALKQLLWVARSPGGRRELAGIIRHTLDTLIKELDSRSRE